MDTPNAPPSNAAFMGSVKPVKRIFDTLLERMSDDEIVAVLAYELGLPYTRILATFGSANCGDGLLL